MLKKHEKCAKNTCLFAKKTQKNIKNAKKTRKILKKHSFSLKYHKKMTKNAKKTRKIRKNQIVERPFILYYDNIMIIL